jgi:hypothetical protein
MPVSFDDFQEVKDMVRQLHTALIGSNQIPGAIPELKDLVEKLDKRVNQLEKWRYYNMGALGMIVFYVKYFLFPGKQG